MGANISVIQKQVVQAASGEVQHIPILFDGRTYDPRFDAHRLNTQYKRVFDLMSDEKWRTLKEISQATGDQQQSVSARLRDFRKQRWGGHTVERRPRAERERGLVEYRLIVNRAA